MKRLWRFAKYFCAFFLLSNLHKKPVIWYRLIARAEADSFIDKLICKVSYNKNPAVRSAVNVEVKLRS